jgi:hypothetical protein
MQVEKNIIGDEASKMNPDQRIVSAGCGKYVSVII